MNGIHMGNGLTSGDQPWPTRKKTVLVRIFMAKSYRDPWPDYPLEKMCQHQRSDFVGQISPSYVIFITWLPVATMYITLPLAFPLTLPEELFIDMIQYVNMFDITLPLIYVVAYISSKIVEYPRLSGYLTQLWKMSIIDS